MSAQEVKENVENILQLLNIKHIQHYGKERMAKMLGGSRDGRKSVIVNAKNELSRY